MCHNCFFFKFVSIIDFSIQKSDKQIVRVVIIVGENLENNPVLLTTDILILSVTGGILPYRVICVGFIRDKNTSIVHLLCSEESTFSAVQNSNLDSLAYNH